MVAIGLDLGVFIVAQFKTLPQWVLAMFALSRPDGGSLFL
jgi:hypothetical protein